MANKAVKGRVIDTTGSGIQGLTVTAVDFDPFFNEDDVLGSAETDGSGNYLIQYSEDKYSFWKADRQPDIVVQVFTAGNRLVFESEEKKNVSDDTLTVPDIKIHRNHLDGWLVTHATLKPEDGTPVALFPQNEITYLIDGGEMFPAVTDAAQAANTSINLMTLNFDVANHLITEFKQGFDPLNPPTENCGGIKEATLEDVLKDKAKDVPNGSSGLDINVLVSNIPLTASDTVSETRKFFKDTGIKTSDFNKGFALLHSKAMIVDGFTAYLMGSPLKQGYFSDQRHHIHDARHHGSLIHDVNVKVAGPAVAHIEKTFHTIWKVNATLDTNIQPVITDRPGPNSSSVQVLRTLPGETFKRKDSDPVTDEHLPFGETGVLEGYQRAIMKAQQFIYFENQYFTAPEIASTMIARMKDTTQPKLQIILVLNVVPDLPGYPDEQVNMVNRLKAAAETHGHQLGVYTLWSRSPKKDNPTQFEIMPIYVHSKTAVIDDVWGTTGSANLDGTSLNVHQFGLIIEGTMLDKVFDGLEPTDDMRKFLKNLVKHVAKFMFFELSLTWKALVALFVVLYELVFNFKDLIKSLKEGYEALLEAGDAIAIFKDVFTRYSQHAVPTRSVQPSRSVEMNVVMFNGIADQPQSAVVPLLRQRLWQEHLGLSALPPELQTVPTDPATMKWVEFWNNTAKANKEALQKGLAAPNPNAPLILAWTGDDDPKHYLKDLKISTKNLRSSGDNYDFTKCKYVVKSWIKRWLSL